MDKKRKKKEQSRRNAAEKLIAKVSKIKLRVGEHRDIERRDACCRDAGIRSQKQRQRATGRHSAPRGTN